jgi:acyl dehydratase
MMCRRRQGEAFVLTDDMIGRPSGTSVRTWTADESALYALAVGAGVDPRLHEASLAVGDGFALPTLVCLLGLVDTPDEYIPDPVRMLHGEQSLVMHAALPAAGACRSRARIADVVDKGRDALVVVETEVEANGAPLATLRSTIFLRGAGGFSDHARRPIAPASPAHADPVPVVRLRTTLGHEQALLYRLTGDRNRLHWDTAFAASAGFDRPILHGMCTFGVAGRLLMHEFAEGRPERIKAFSARFSRPVFPGDELSVEAWPTGEGTYGFRALRPGGEVVLSRGRLDVAGPGDRAQGWDRS